ncbi:MAG: radical SAM protein [Bacteroidota bacterium]
MNHNSLQKKIILFEPPHGRVWDIPYGTLPALTGFLRLHGYCTEQHDLNTQILLQLLEKDNISQILDLIDQRIKMAENKLAKRKKGIISRIKKFVLKNARTLPLVRKIYFNFVSHKVTESDKGYSLIWNLRSSKRKILQHYDEMILLKEKWEQEISSGNYNLQLFTLLNKIYKILLDAIEVINGAFGKNADFFSRIKNKEFNLYFQLYEPYIKAIEQDKVSVVGITASYDNKLAALTLAEIIRKRFPEIHVVMGGLLFHDAHFYDKNDQDDIKQVLKECAHTIVVGEGETALKELLEVLADKRELKDVSNILWLDNEKLIINKPFRYENPEDLPDYDFEGLPLKYYSGLPVEVNRGCYWSQCSFCRYYHNFHHRKKYKQTFYRSFNTDRIISQVKILIEKYGTKNFEFICLDISPVEARNLSEAIISNSLNIKWNARVRLDKSFTPDLLHLMQKSGATMFMFYPETFSNKTADLHHKNYDIDHVKSLIRYWSDHKNELPALVVKLMTGFPGESFKDFMESYHYVKNNGIMIQNIGLFNLSKGSGVFYNPEKFGVKIVPEKNNNDLFHHYTSKWLPAYKKERFKIEKWLFNNRKKWRKLCIGWSMKYKVFHEQ